MAKNKLVPLKVKLVNGSYAVGGNGAAANDFDISKLGKFPWVGLVSLILQGTRTAGSSTLNVEIEVSPDGTNYSDLVAFTQQDSASLVQEVKQITIPAGATFRTDISLGTGTTCTVVLYAIGYVDGDGASPA